MSMTNRFSAGESSKWNFCQFSITSALRCNQRYFFRFERMFDLELHAVSTQNTQLSSNSVH